MRRNPSNKKAVGARRYAQAPTQPFWRNLLVPIVQWVGLGALFAGLAVVIAVEVRSPQIVESNEAQEALQTPEGAYTLTSLHQRLPPEGVERVQRNIRYFQTKGRKRVQRGLARSGKYLETFQKVFRKRGLPEELAYLPLIESGFVTDVVSSAQAVGLWQFISETGRRYNLHQNNWADRRLDPFQSAEAAAKLLKNLYGIFGDWEHALAAYNAGAGTLRWAIRKNRKAGKPTHFWALELPDETTNYVPHFLAAMLIAKHPRAYGFGEIDFQALITYDNLKVSPGTSLEHLAVVGGIPPKVLFDLNPALIRGQVPPGDQPYRLRVPSGSRRELTTRLTGVDLRYRDWMVHRVEHDDTVEALAYRFRSKSQRIKKANGLTGDEELAYRNFILIPL